MARHISRRSSRTRFLAVAATLVVAVGTALLGGGTANASTPRTVCTGGDIASGWYGHLSIKGSCTIPDSATVNVKGNIWLAPGAVLNAVTLATVHVGGDIIVSHGAVLGLGCTILGVGCAADSDTTVKGSILADRPLTMFIDGSKIGGDVISNGGGPGPSVTQSDLAFNFAFKDNTVGGSVVLTGWSGGWNGAIRDTVGGNLVYSQNRGTDPDANEIVNNTVGANLACHANKPKAQFGDAVIGAPPGYGPNHVGGKALDQCKALV